MKKNETRTVPVRIPVDITYTRLKDAIAKLTLYVELYPDAMLDICSFEEYGSCGIQCDVVYERPMTQEELDEEKRYSDAYTANRRLQYEQLKKEFGD